MRGEDGTPLVRARFFGIDDNRRACQPFSDRSIVPSTLNESDDPFDSRFRCVDGDLFEVALALTLTIHRGRWDIALIRYVSPKYSRGYFHACYSSSAGLVTVPIEFVIESLTSIDGALTGD